MQGPHCFDFNHHLAIDDQIYALTAYDLALIDDIYLFLTLEGDASQRKFMAQCFFVNRLKRTRTQDTMYLDSASYDHLGQQVLGSSLWPR